MTATENTLRIVPTRLDDPVAVALVADQQAELASRYGGTDPVDTTPEEFWPPRGIFLLAWLGEAPVGCGGLKDLDADFAELKRLYVAPKGRGQGVARALLAALERLAADAGVAGIRLITGPRQPEAVQLYRSAGWTPGELYGPAIEHGWTEALVFERRLAPVPHRAGEEPAEAP